MMELLRPSPNRIPRRLARTTTRACLAVLSLLLVTPSAPAGEAASTPAQNFIPVIAGVAKIQIGFSTQRDLEAQWGEGKTITGGHPNSGRLWRVKGTHWLLHTDAFEYSKRGLVVDHLEIREEQKPEEGIPYARLGAKDFSWLGEIALGATQAKVTEVLKRKGLPVTPTDMGCETSTAGIHALENKAQFRTWKVRFDFKNGILIRLVIDANF